MLSIREGYINIYYRGGNILKLEEQSERRYEPSFDSQYNKSGKAIPALPKDIKDPNDVKKWVESFPFIKEIMDFYFSGHPKPEREFQQLVARENNFSTIANQTEYFVSDIEFADSALGARFDILAVRWLISQRKSSRVFRPAFIEIKYGDGALRGNAGVLKHLKDIETLITYGNKYNELIKTMESQFNQLDKLGLLRFNRVANWTKIKLEGNERHKPEVIFILTSHNPRSSKLRRILNDPKIDEYDHSPNFDLRFYVASFAGYALHADCMLTLSQFRELLQKRKAKKGAP